MTAPRLTIFLCLPFVLPCLAFGQMGNEAAIEGHSILYLISPLGENVNTPADEFSCFRYADKLYFSSEIKSGQKNKEPTRMCTALSGEPAFVLPENPRDFSKNMAHAIFDLKAERMYYCLSGKGRDGQEEDCSIVFRDRNYDGTWGPPAQLPKSINMHGHVTTQPAYGYVQGRKKQVLFFVSDRPGGKGGLDIWASEITKGMGTAEDKYGEPFNLPINTEGDDVSPFFDTRMQALFFSSNGRMGYGGFDIYISKTDREGQWSRPVNLVEPINSADDDLYFSFHHSSGLAYFSSNRLGGNCPSPECRNFDVYKAQMKVEMQLNIKEATSGSFLPGCNVELIDAKTGDILSTHLKVDEGRLSVDLTPAKPYRILVSQMGYFPVSFEVQASPVEVFSKLEKTVALKPM